MIFTTLFTLVVLCLMVYTLFDNRDRVRSTLAQTFAKLHFASADSDDGYLGRDLIVLKQVEPFLFTAYDDRNRFAGDHAVSDVYWYCKSASGEYFMAMAMLGNHYGKYQVKWVVRSLTAERMRAVLQAYPKAYRAEFGVPE